MIANKNKPNIFHFGDSLSDPGNFVYELGKHFQPKSKDINPSQEGMDNKGDTGITFQLRISQLGTFSDGNTFAYFLAEKLHMNYLKGSQIDHIPEDGNNYINFALGGASQDNNIGITEMKSKVKVTPGKYFGSFRWEIRTFQHLINHRRGKHLAHLYDVKPNDLFMYMFVGANDLFIIFDHYLEMEHGKSVHKLVHTNTKASHQTNKFDKKLLEDDINTMIGNYVKSTIENLNTLYELGMRRLVLGTIDDITFSILYQKYQLLEPGCGDVMQTILTTMQSLLRKSLKKTQWQDLEIEFISLSDIMSELQNNYDHLEIENPLVGKYPHYNSLAGSNRWPSTSPKPITDDRKLLFSDDVHPTEHTHKIVADILFEDLQQFSL